jgi:hypothetical protein
VSFRPGCLVEPKGNVMLITDVHNNQPQYIVGCSFIMLISCSGYDEWVRCFVIASSGQVGWVTLNQRFDKCLT